MAEPLTQHVAAPAPAPAPVREPVEEKVAAVAPQEIEEEPSLFEAIEPARPAYADDGLPPPAYRPEPEPQPQRYATAQTTSRPAPGTPTPEALARLERVTGRAPGSLSGHRPGEAQFGSSRGEAPAEPHGERPRFGINTLINRMSGVAPGGESRSNAVRQQPPVSSSYAEPSMSEDQERIEIPAFLRRQAN
jgi:cell division protein FtsZ